MIEFFEMISTKQLQKLVMELPKKKGTEEGITSDILKAVFHVIKEKYVEVINASLREDCFPDSLKTSTIIPIPKVGKAGKASEFRPINVLPIHEKILELVVKQQIKMYLQDNCILTEHQSGFRKRFSCETAIQTVIDKWKLIISEAKMVGYIFIDLEQAFETIGREKLLEKLWQYGIRGTALEWFKSYLKNRTQLVRLNKECSTHAGVHNLWSTTGLCIGTFVIYNIYK